MLPAQHHWLRLLHMDVMTSILLIIQLGGSMYNRKQLMCNPLFELFSFRLVTVDKGI
mgnify:CR=1 FL=1